MLTRIEATQYRCLQAVNQPLRPFQILVGPNASGKTTFLDVVSFLGTLVSVGLETAVKERTSNFQDLVWGREGNRFELAVEAEIPEERRVDIPEQDFMSRYIQYEIGVGVDPATDRVLLYKDLVTLLGSHDSMPRAVIARGDRQRVTFRNERTSLEQEFVVPQFYSGLANLPIDEVSFPAAVWLKNLLTTGIQAVNLDPEKLRRPSPPTQGPIGKFDGSSLARLVFQMQERHPQTYEDWLRHVRTVLGDIEKIRTVFRPEDNTRYLMLRYQNGVEAPSWIVSEGTLRFLALTALAYAPEFRGIYLIEEPENGVHPTALEAIYQSLSSVYDAQVFVTTHSPVLLGLAKPEELLCFTKTSEGAEIVSGDKHPALQDWRGEVSLGVLFGAGVLS